MKRVEPTTNRPILGNWMGQSEENRKFTLSDVKFNFLYSICQDRPCRWDLIAWTRRSVTGDVGGAAPRKFRRIAT